MLVDFLLSSSTSDFFEMALTNYTWSFDPIVSGFPETWFPNVALWNVTSGSDLQYQVTVSWPLEWDSREEANGSALTM